MERTSGSRSSISGGRQRVVLGRVVGAHGIGGEIRVRYFGDGPQNLLAMKRVALAEPRRGEADPAPLVHEIEGGGTARGGEVRLRLRGITGRDEAQALRGRLVVVDASALPPPPEGEFYWYQLVGCRVEREDGEPVGIVEEIWEAAAHDLLVVEDEGRRALIPTAREIMREVDLAHRRIVVADVPGLIETRDPQDREPR